MIVRLEHRGQRLEANLAAGYSLALPLRPDATSVRAWHVPPLSSEPVQVGDWVGSVDEGAAVNFATLCMTPHGSGTHTETYAHIAPLTEENTMLALLPQAPFVATLWTVPTNVWVAGKGRVVDLSSFRQNPPTTAGLILRTLTQAQQAEGFSGKDAPYFAVADTAWLAQCGVQHLITDLPSLDREEDGGALAAHKAFWGYPDAIRQHCTVTELARLNQLPNSGLYLVTLNALPLASDASPSHPQAYALSPPPL